MVFDSIDLHYVREQRGAEVADDASLLRAAARTRSLELDVIARSDETLVVSAAEAEVLAVPEPAAQVPGLQQLQDVAGLRVQLEEPSPPLSEPAPVQLQLPERVGRVAAQPAPPPALTASIEAPRVPIPQRRELDESVPQGAELGDVAHWKNLPSAVQRQLRELGINAHVYSADSNLRFIRASGRSLREGDRLSAELRLQQITRDGMVFTYQDGKYWMRLN